MKSKTTKPLTSKANKKHEVTSIVSVTQPSKKVHRIASSNIDTDHLITFNVNRLADIIMQIENVRKGLKILASEVKALK
jgi:hypothetical protein